MTVKEIVKAYLDANGFDGLFSDDGDCACQKDDLAPCGGCDNIMDCGPGYLTACTCGEHDWHFSKSKE